MNKFIFSVTEVPYTTIGQVKQPEGFRREPYVVFQKPKSQLWLAVDSSLDSPEIKFSHCTAEEKISVPVFKYVVPSGSGVSSAIFAAGVQAGMTLDRSLRGQLGDELYNKMRSVVFGIPIDLPTEQQDEEGRFVWLACLIKPVDVV